MPLETRRLVVLHRSDGVASFVLGCTAVHVGRKVIPCASTLRWIGPAGRRRNRPVAPPPTLPPLCRSDRAYTIAVEALGGVEAVTSRAIFLRLVLQFPNITMDVSSSGGGGGGR